MAGDNYDDDLDDLGDIYCHVQYVGVKGGMSHECFYGGDGKILNNNH